MSMHRATYAGIQYIRPMNGFLANPSAMPSRKISNPTPKTFAQQYHLPGNPRLSGKTLLNLLLAKKEKIHKFEEIQQ